MSLPGRSGVEVPWTRLDAATLQRVAEEFVTREGTDYGEGEFGLADKVKEVLRQLERGEAVLVFDTEAETIDIVPARSRR